MGCERAVDTICLQLILRNQGLTCHRKIGATVKITILNATSTLTIIHNRRCVLRFIALVTHNVAYLPFAVKLRGLSISPIDMVE